MASTEVRLPDQTEPPKVLFRRFNSTGASYVFIACVNKISQLNSTSLSLLNERITGPKNCSIFCFVPGDSCIPCNQYPNRPLPSGYHFDDCGPRLTNAFVKAWSTSNFEYVESLPDSLPENSVFSESYLSNNDFIPVEDALYVCYNVFHGFCERLQLTNISVIKPWIRRPSPMDFYPKRSSDIPIPVVNWNASLSSTLTVDRSYIYVGLEQDQFQDATLVDLDPISIRLRDFDYASQEPSVKSSLRLREIEREIDFRIKYKFSFQYTLEQGHRVLSHHVVPYVYFVAQQPSTIEPGMLETRIARVCSGDKFLHSYADLELSCEGCLLHGRGQTQKKFGALNMAARGAVGTETAMPRFTRLSKSKVVPKWRKPLSFSGDFNNVLLVAFASQLAEFADPTSPWNPNLEAKNSLIRGTAITFYTLAEIRLSFPIRYPQIDVWFGLVIENCLTGKTSIGPPHFFHAYPKKCEKDGPLLSLLKLDQYCPANPMNWPISGSIRSERLSAPPILMLDVDVTGIAITRVADAFTVLVVTTDEGELLKVRPFGSYPLSFFGATACSISPNSEDGEARLIASKQLTSRRRPLRGLTLDDTGLVAFAISDEKHFSVPSLTALTIHTLQILKYSKKVDKTEIDEGCKLISRHLINLNHERNRDLCCNAFKVYRVELQNCSTLDSCGACLALRDPHCGWCLAEGVCTHKAACSTPWLSYRTSASRCPKIVLVDPSGMDVNQRGGLASEVHTLTLRPSAILSRAFTASLSSTAAGWWRRQRRLLCAFRYRHPTDRGEEADPWRRRGMLYGQTEASLIPDSNNVNCNLPEPTELPTLDHGEQLKETLVWLELAKSSTASTDSTYPLAAGVFTVYDCRRFTDCQICLSSRFDCVWHPIEGRCLSSTDSGNSYLISPLPIPPSHLEPSFLCIKSECKCPIFIVDQMITTIEALKPVSVVASVSNTPTVAERFSCSENCTDRWTAGVYNRTSSTVTCTFPGISVADVIRNSGNATGLGDVTTWHHNLLNFATLGVVKCEIRIHWHNNQLPNQPKLGHPLVNLKAASLEVFECGRMAAHCDSCLALPPRFACVWCPAVSTPTTALESTMACSRVEQCSSIAPVTFCPHRLLKVIPENATLSGQAPLTIRGINLGSELQDLEITVVFADSDLESIACAILPEGFQPSRQVTCRLQPMGRSPKQPETPLKCHIALRLRKAHAETTFLPFTFFSPKIESFSPQKGPIAGGTLLRIYGRDLNVGAFVTVVLVLGVVGRQNKVECEVIYLSADMITCRTQAVDPVLLPFASKLESGAADGIPSSVALFHDKTLTKAPLQTFFYKPDPTIRTVSKTVVFFSGGTTIYVYGQYLDVIESPQIVFYHNGMEFVETCQYEHVYLCCVSPSLTLDGRRKRAFDAYSNTIVRPITNPSIIPKIHSFEHDDDSPDNFGKTHSAILVPYGFIMDNVTDVLVFGAFSVFSNPEVFPFVEGRLVESFPPRSSSATSKEAFFSTDGAVVEEDHLESPPNSGKSSSVQDRHLLRFHGNFETLADASDLQAPEELSVIVITETAENQTNRTCKPIVLKPDEIRCELNLNDLVEGKDYPIVVQFGRYLKFRPGVVQFKRLGPLGGRDRAVIVASSLMGVVTLVACLFLAMWCRSRRTERDLEKRFQIRWAEQEKCVARAFKNGTSFLRLLFSLEISIMLVMSHLILRILNALLVSNFIELQTHVEELVQDLNRNSLPIRDYQTYCLFSLFPEYHQSLVRPSDPHDMPPRTGRPRPNTLEDVSAPNLLPHPLVSVFKVPANVQEVADRGIFLFNRLLHNHRFLCLLVHSVESNRNIDARAKSQIASLLSIILHPDMEYFTQIILSLITDLLRKSRDHGGDGRLLTAFRRAESVIAKMLSNWFTFLLYNFIREHAAEHLFILYRALRQQINTGPRDAVTGLARYTLDAATLLKSDLLSRPIMLLVVDPEGLFGSLCPANMAVRVLSCDTVTQAKEKILDAIYRNTPYKSQLRPTDVHLRALKKTASLLMMDWDLDVRRDATNASIEGPPYRLNCLSDYKMTDNDVVALVRAEGPFTLINGSGTLPAVSSRVVHGCTSPSGSLPLLLHQPPYSPPLFNGHQQVPFNIRPTGGPSALLWYHLERPTNVDLQVTERSGRARGEEELGLSHHRPLCCHPRSYEMSSTLLSNLSPSSPPTLPAQQQQPCGGLDARSLRRWLATEDADTSIGERSRTSQRRNRRSLRRPGGPRSASGAAYETVELVNNGTDDPDGAIDRPMAKLPCEIFLNRLLRTRILPKSCAGTIPAKPHHEQLKSTNCATACYFKKLDVAPMMGRSINNTLLKASDLHRNEVFWDIMSPVSVAKYMERVVELIFGAVVDSQSPPLCIKFLFDFLDLQAEALGIHDPGVLHAWKANCLHLRFWNQILINLDYVFDIPLLRNTALERSFHSFSQAITYACSPVLDKVTMDSPINKALFSSDIERHWLTVKRYFAEIKAMPAISQHDMNVSLCQHSKNHKAEFNVSWALYELYTRYVILCYDALIAELRPVVTAEVPTSDLSYNVMENTESYSYSHGTTSLQGDFLEHQNNNWDPLCLLQTLQEVNSCMMAVACSSSKRSSDDKPSTSKPQPSSPLPSVLQPHHQLSNGRGQSSLRSVVPHSERRLPPLPTPP
ncbi:Plexin-A4 [Taenia solium]|eukprot:TsM_000139000 transcript=TsM_000139000 gene=TsM_000139000